MGPSAVNVILAVFLPPLAVFLSEGCNSFLFCNIILTVLGWFPGILHALYVVLEYHKDDPVPATSSAPATSPTP